MTWYPRENYLKKIRDFYHETDIIKVITGVRRCGKSCLMETIANKLESSGFPTFRLRIPLHYQRKRKTVSTDRLKQLKTIIQNM